LTPAGVRARRTTPGSNGAPGLARAADRVLAARLRAFERYFSRVLPRASETPARLHAAMRYAALAPGKRVRPLLALGACEAAGGRWQHALPAAAAVECVHAFSLVHDDLPAMDDDDFRRGRPTTHRKYGEGMAILAGDALLALGFEQIARLAERGVRPARVARAARLLAEACGSRELIGGQALDLEAEGRRVSRAGVRSIHSRKTGALVRAALELGGIAAGAGERTLAALASLGRDLGLAFQIHDDLLNVGSSLSRLGKRAGTDAARGKATWPLVVGESRAREDAARLYARTIDRVAAFGTRGRGLARLVIAVAERER
jgi:geranylgeranyl pyrophosphate synthase